MPAAKSNQETEIKLRLDGAAAGRRLLRRAGFRIKRRRGFESNVVYDTPDGRLRAAGQLLRLRRTGRRSLLTYKGFAPPGRYKSREEVETLVEDGDRLDLILRRLGFQVSFRYEKYRTVYQVPDAAGLVTLDETPIGDFLELEGPPSWIDATAAELGYQPSDYITATYAELFFQSPPRGGRNHPPRARRRTATATDMVFES